MDDDAVKVIINPDSNRSGLSEDMNCFLDLLLGRPGISGLAKDISTAVENAKLHREWEVTYMTLELKLKEEREEGRIEIIKNALSNGMSENSIKQILNVSDEEILKAKEF